MVDSIDIHIFGDTSLIGASAITYVIVNQPSGTEQVNPDCLIKIWQYRISN